MTADHWKALPVSFSEATAARHHLYLKQHAVRAQPSDARTLLILNAPSYANQECIKRLFKGCGAVQRVLCHKKPTSQPERCQPQPVKGFKAAYVVFKKPSAITKALNLDAAPRLLSKTENPLLVGVQKWTRAYADGIPEGASVEKETEIFVQRYKQALLEKQNVEKKGSVPDEDGWVTVTRRTKFAAGAGSETHLQKDGKKEKKKRSSKELVNFYSFQIRESKMQHIANLRKKFEQDKQRIALMRASRKFKPY